MRQGRTKSRARKWLLLLAAVGLCVSLGAGALILPRAAIRKVEKSIAVLPFENLSDNKENAYFADGIQDDILTNIAKISDLKVISRTSVMSYRGNPKSVLQIAKALGVSTILEGSVQRDQQNRVRVNVQLIDAYNDRHLWAQVYDRELTDVFAIQSELAQKIATALKATLSADEQQRIERKPTQNGEAYFLALRAHEIFNRPDRHHDDVARAEALYEEAIALDPTFALAYARLSHLESWSYYAIEPTPARMQKAREAANEALRLQPHLAEAHLAIGLVYYYLDHDYDRALGELAIARDDLPNDAVVARIIAAIQRRQGRWQESSASYEKAASLDPKDPILLENMGWNFLSTRNYAEAAKVFDRAGKSFAGDFHHSRSASTRRFLPERRSGSDARVACQLAGVIRPKRHGDIDALQLRDVPKEFRGASRDVATQPGRDFSRRNERANSKIVSARKRLCLPERREEREGKLRRGAALSGSESARESRGRAATRFARIDLRRIGNV